MLEFLPPRLPELKRKPDIETWWALAWKTYWYQVRVLWFHWCWTCTSSPSPIAYLCLPCRQEYSQAWTHSSVCVGVRVYRSFSTYQIGLIYKSWTFQGTLSIHTTFIKYCQAIYPCLHDSINAFRWRSCSYKTSELCNLKKTASESGIRKKSDSLIALFRVRRQRTNDERIWQGCENGCIYLTIQDASVFWSNLFDHDSRCSSLLRAGLGYAGWICVDTARKTCALRFLVDLPWTM